MIRERTKHVVTHTRLVRIWLVETLVSKSLCLVSVMLQRLPAVLSRIGIILASPLVRPPIALGRGHDFARILFFSLHQISLSLSLSLSASPSIRLDSTQSRVSKIIHRLINILERDVLSSNAANATFLFLLFSVSRSFDFFSGFLPIRREQKTKQNEKKRKEKKRKMK